MSGPPHQPRDKRTRVQGEYLHSWLSQFPLNLVQRIWTPSENESSNSRAQRKSKTPPGWHSESNILESSHPPPQVPKEERKLGILLGSFNTSL